MLPPSWMRVKVDEREAALSILARLNFLPMPLEFPSPPLPVSPENPFKDRRA